jgi:hypothetical protein
MHSVLPEQNLDSSGFGLEVAVEAAEAGYYPYWIHDWWLSIVSCAQPTSHQWHPNLHPSSS